jgi:hypothetical protein
LQIVQEVPPRKDQRAGPALAVSFVVEAEVVVGIDEGDVDSSDAVLGTGVLAAEGTVRIV